MQATIGRATASLATVLFPLRSSRCHALRNGCSPASSCRLQGVKQASRQSFRATHALAIPSCCNAVNIRHTRNARAQSQESARTLRPSRWRRSCLRTSLIRSLDRRAVAGCFGGCHALLCHEATEFLHPAYGVQAPTLRTQKPRQPPGYGVSCCLQRGQATSPPPLRRLFNPALYRRRHAACRGKASAPPASLKNVGASLQVRFASSHGAERNNSTSPWGTAKTKPVCLFPQGPFASALQRNSRGGAFVCAALFSPLQQKFARLQEAAVPPGNGFQT